MSIQKSTNVVWQSGRVERRKRQEIFNQQGATLWLTGLSGAGKSTLAFLLEHLLVEQGYKAYVLDGDNVRHGLNSNLGFSAADREENIRRVGEVAKLFADAGMIVLASFISPFRRDRDLVRDIHKAADLNFIEIFIDTPLAVCEQRDPKQLYAKARRGEIKDFTGISSPYEIPEHPELRLSNGPTPQQQVATVLDYLQQRGIIRRK
ncbi:MAG TPA: adenylyl-sulfate kinase [Candidatus Acidoferrum sp.]|nr:adenylyl-sulfate kinase [Candidatus Acidoferrum sp.]